MKRHPHLAGLLFLIAFCAIWSKPTHARLPGQPQVKAVEELPYRLDFIENKGQWTPEIQYKADLLGGALFITGSGFVYNYEKEADLRHIHDLLAGGASREQLHQTKINQYAYKVHFVGGNSSAAILPDKKRSHYHNYFIGNDQSKWAGNVPLYGLLTQKELYAGIDMVVYGSEQNTPKYDFIVAPLADPQQIRLRFEGIRPVLTKEGDLKLTTTVNEVIEKAPIAYQVKNGKRINVPVLYRLEGQDLGFSFPEGYDPAIPLVIDPELVFCTYSGSSKAGFYSFATTYDNQGNTIASGKAKNTGWPVTTGAFQTAYNNGFDICINKYNALGTGLVYSTYYGGSSVEYPHALKVNAQNELFLVGSTESSNLPVTPGCYDNTLGGTVDIFVAHFNLTGTQLIGATYIGGSGQEPSALTLDPGNSLEPPLGEQYVVSPLELDFDANGNVWVVGNTKSTNFPVTPNAQQSTFGGGDNDGVVFQLNPNCSQLLYSSYLGGNGTDGLYGILVNGSQVIVCGFSSNNSYPTTPGSLHPNFLGGSRDAVVTVLNASNGSILHSTFLGTSSWDEALQLQLGPDGYLYVMGRGVGSYPVTPGVYSMNNGNVFIDVLTLDLATSIRRTKVGGVQSNNTFFPDGFQVDNCGNVYVTGMRAPNNLPTTSNAFSSNSSSNFWFCVLRPEFTGLLYASYFGLSADHTHCGVSRIDKDGIIYHSICTDKKNYPHITPGTWAPSFPGGFFSVGQDMITFKFDFQLTGVEAQILLPPGGTDSVCASTYTLNLSNGSTSPYPMTFTWNPGDGSPNSTGTNFTHTYTSPGVYDIILQAHSDSTCNIDDFDTFRLTIFNVDPPNILVSPDTVICGAVASVNLHVDIFNPSPNNVIQWSPSAGVLSGGNSATATVNPAYGTFYVSVSDSISGLCGMTVTDSVTISFSPADTIPLQATICFGDTYILNGQPYGSSGTYYASWASSSGCDSTVLLNLTVLPPPVILPTILIDSCTQASFEGVIYTSDTVLNDTLFFANYSCDSAYRTVQITIDQSNVTNLTETICFGDTMFVGSQGFTTTGLHQVTYSTAAGCDSVVNLDLIVLPPPVVLPTIVLDSCGQVAFEGTTYTSNATLNDTFYSQLGCDSAYRQVTIIVHPSASSNLNEAICAGDSFVLGGQVFHTAGAYQVNFTSVQGCDSTVHLTLTVLSNSEVYDTLRICHEDLPYSFGTQVLTTSGNYSDTISSSQGCYQITYLSFTALSPAQTKTIDTSACVSLFFEGVTYTQNTQILDTITGANGCDSLYRSIQIKISPSPTTTVQEKRGCETVSFNGQTFTQDTTITQVFSTVSGCDSILLVTNIRVDQKVSDTSQVSTCEGEHYTFGDLELSAPGIYFKSYPRPSGCDSISVIVLTVHHQGKPSIRIDPAKESYCVGDQITLRGSGAQFYYWSNGRDVQDIEGEEVTITLSQPFNQIYLTGKNEFGCQDSAQLTLFADDCEDIFIPNAFTPNNDGLNDKFGVQLNGHPGSFRLELFNRWGQLVFHSSDPREHWDGFINQIPADVGVYYYQVTGKWMSGKDFYYKGSFTLLR